MKVTPHRVGATVDVTAEALPLLLDELALVYAADPTRIGALLMGLATAREHRDGLVEHPGVDRPVDVIESAEVELDGARDALTGELSGVQAVFTVAETDCRAHSAQFAVAADQSVTAIVRATQMIQSLSLLRQKDRRHVA